MKIYELALLTCLLAANLPAMAVEQSAPPQIPRSEEVLSEDFDGAPSDTMLIAALATEKSLAPAAHFRVAMGPPGSMHGFGAPGFPPGFPPPVPPPFANSMHHFPTPMAGGFMSMGRVPDFSLAALSLSDEQMQRLNELRDQFDVQTAGKRAELKSSMHRMMNAFTETSINMNKCDSLQIKVNVLKTDLSAAETKFLFDRMQVLTGEQRQKLAHIILSAHFGPKQFSDQKQSNEKAQQ